jgi:hypothetical protein
MGDGQHIWAAAEWLMFVRNLFVREEADTLILGAGVRTEWLEAGPIQFGATLTPHGPVSLELTLRERIIHARVTGTWRDRAPRRELRVPGFVPVIISAGNPATEFSLSR